VRKGDFKLTREDIVNVLIMAEHLMAYCEEMKERVHAAEQADRIKQDKLNKIHAVLQGRYEDADRG
jgi:hypothetical protein